MKKFFLGLILLAAFNCGAGLAAEPPAEGFDSAKIAALKDLITANSQKISSLETSLNGLKIDPRANMWNFIGRSGNEKIIQKRSRITREISALKEENFRQSSVALKHLEPMHSRLKDSLSDRAFLDLLVWLDGLAVSRAEEITVTPANDAALKDDSPKKSEFLRYRASAQADYLKDVRRIKALIKSAQEALKTANQQSFDSLYASYLKKLGDKEAALQESQAMITNYLR